MKRPPTWMCWRVKHRCLGARAAACPPRSRFLPRRKYAPAARRPAAVLRGARAARLNLDRGAGGRCERPGRAARRGFRVTVAVSRGGVARCARRTYNGRAGV